MKTFYTPVDEIDRKWYVADADGKVLGRMAAEIARLADREDLTLKEAALALGYVTAAQYEAWVVPAEMTGPR